MRVQLVSHASLLIETADCVIWTDPWLFGKAFNDSWSLFPPASFDEARLDRIDYIWISHEHPDHFHIPTLRSLPSGFRERVTVLHQELNTDRMVVAFHKLGFPRVQTLAHRKLVSLRGNTRVYCYHVGIMDSCLAVDDGTHRLLNSNDAVVTAPDCRRILADMKSVDVNVTQFSIAYYSGQPDYTERLRTSARGMLNRIWDLHVTLRARVTIPFASLIYYSSVENRYVNQFHNTPRKVYEHLKARGLDVAVLYPGDSYNLGAPYDSERSLVRYDEAYAQLPRASFDMPRTVDLIEIENAFASAVRRLRENHSALFLRLLRPLRVRIPDLEKVVEFSIPTGRFQIFDSSAEADMIISSQPLQFAFSNPYGIQTLGVSARYTLLRDSMNWRLHRFLFSLDNAQIHLRPRRLLNRKTVRYLRSRSSGGFHLLIYVTRRLFASTRKVPSAAP